MAKKSKEINVTKEIMYAIADLIRTKVFYSHIIQQFVKELDSKAVLTAGVGKRADENIIHLYVNQDFIRSIRENDAKNNDNKFRKIVRTIMEHEVLHVVFGHLWLDFPDKHRQAIAVDLAVNSYVDHDGLTEGAPTPDKFGLEPKKSAAWYYEILATNQKYQQMIANQGKACVEDLKKSHDMWGSFPEDKISQQIVKDIINKAQKLCEGSYGDVPLDVIEQVNDFLLPRKPIIPWERVLRTFVASSSESIIDYTKKRISKRFGTRPGTIKEDVLDLAVAVDTSGSIDDSSLVMFFGEIFWIWRNGAKVTIYEADCEIQSVYPYAGKFHGEVHGRGGTDLEPVLKEVVGKHNALVYFTDFYAPVIRMKYNIQTLWVLNNRMDKTEYPYPWGTHVCILDTARK